MHRDIELNRKISVVHTPTNDWFRGPGPQITAFQTFISWQLYHQINVYYHLRDV